MQIAVYSQACFHERTILLHRLFITQLQKFALEPKEVHFNHAELARWNDLNQTFQRVIIHQEITGIES